MKSDAITLVSSFLLEPVSLAIMFFAFFLLESIFFRLFRWTNTQLEKGVATKTYYPQIKILERNGHIKETAVKFTAEILIKAKNSSFFPES